MYRVLRKIIFVFFKAKDLGEMIENSIPIIVENIKEELPGVRSIFVKRKDGENISYRAGQFLHLGFQQRNGIGYRSYSFSTIPKEGTGFTVKERENGDISRLLQETEIGEELALINVGGKFVLPTDMNAIQQVFFFAAGSGITPIFSLIKSILSEYKNVKIYLAYSNSAFSSAIFYEELQDLERQNSERLRVNFIFSDAKNLLKARMSGFRLQDIMKAERNADWTSVLAYACGPVEYMDNIKITLLTEGLPSANFFMEYFDTISDDQAVPPEDKEEHLATFILEGESFTIPVKYPDTLLSAALDAGLSLPYSCRSGQCGSCAATIKQGKVWLQYNEVLTPDELAKGLTLTCMGCPIEGDVVLSYE